MRKVLLVLALVILSIGFARAEGDPSLSADPRLAQKIMCEAKRKTVSSILNDLSEKSGVTLYAGYNNNDWQVRDRKMNVFAKDVPLCDLMSSIARVMKFKWIRREKDGAYTYRLYMDRKTLLSAESQRMRDEAERRRRRAEKRDKFLSRSDEIAGMSEEDIDKLKDQDPFYYSYAKLGCPQLISSLGKEVESARQAWSTGEALALNSEGLPPTVREQIQRTLQSFFSFGQKLSGKTLSFPEHIDQLPVTITLNDKLQSSSYDMPDALIGAVTIRRQGQDSGGDIGILDPDTEIGKRACRELAKLMDAQEPPGEEALNRLNQDFDEAAQSEKTDFGEPPAEHEDNPALHKKVKMKVESDQFADSLAALAEASGMPVVSDSFSKRYMGLKSAGDEQELKDVLDRLAKLCRYNWEKHGQAIEFRDREWFRKRAAQIPEAWMEPWRKALQETGTLDVGDLSQIALLTDEQLWANMPEDDVMQNTGTVNKVAANRDLLRFYVSLDKTQQTALFAIPGLDPRTVGPDQWPVAEKLLSRNPAFLKNPDSRIFLTGERLPNGKQFDYTFIASSSDDLPAIEWKFTTPKYEPPHDEKPTEKGR